MSENKAEKKTDGASKIIIILLVLLIVLIGSFAAYILFFGGASKFHQSSSNNVNNTAKVDTISSADENTYSLDEAIVNLADTDSQRYVKAKVSFGYSEKNTKLKSELESEEINKKPILTDAVNSVLRSKKASDLTGKGIDDTKREIMEKVNPVLKNGKVSNIYFQELVVQ